MADLNDKRLTSVYDGMDDEIAETKAMHDDMIAENDATVQKGIDESKAWLENQQDLQNKQLDQQVKEIEQQKEQSQKDYIKEQSGAYVDWQKESSKYGAKEEQLAAAGLTGSGYHESTQVSLYNTYQNRVAVARESFERTKLNYDNAINEAKLQNSSILAEIAFEASKEQLTLTLEGLQYKNSLLLQKASAVQAIEDRYYNKWKDMLDQINTENALAQDQDQFEKQMEWEKEQFDALHGESEYTDDHGSGEYTGAMYITTDYFTGQIPSSTVSDGQEYGTFSNKYQPKGISGHGAVTKTGDTYKFETETLSGEKKEVEQNIWEAEDGTLWYWEGREMKYKAFVVEEERKHGGSGGSFGNGNTSYIESKYPAK